MRKTMFFGILYTSVVLFVGTLAGMLLGAGKPITGMPPGIYQVVYGEEFFARGTHEEFYYVVAQPMKIVRTASGMNVLQPAGDRRFYMVDPRMVKDPKNGVTLVLDPRITSLPDE